jgi:hypothetical protein
VPIDNNVRSQRFLIVQSYGCSPSTSQTPLSLFVLGILPLTVCVATLALTGKAIAIISRFMLMRSLVFIILVQRRRSSSTQRTGSAEVPPSIPAWRYLLLTSLSVILIVISSSLSTVFIMASGLTTQPDSTYDDGLLLLTDLPILQSLGIMLSWWSAPIVSALVCLVLMSDPENRSRYQQILGCIKRASSSDR